MMEPRSTRISVFASTLFLVVVSCLLAPVGALIVDAMADPPSTGGPLPPGTVISDPISDTVAATAAEFRVDESGAATYAIPIYAAPGTAGVAPKISLKYSSQGAIGPMGKGWSIEGLSGIARCRATREAGDFIASGQPVDGSPGPINFSSTDRYCLDGQRLITVVNTPACPAAGSMTIAQLRTEIESFQRVCAYTPPGGADGPAYFTVERKDGSLSWYGDRDSHASSNRPDGYINATLSAHAGKAIAWAQTRFQDSSGNYIDFHYAENPGGGEWLGEHLITEIRYTGKIVLSGQQGSALEPYASIVFGYDTVLNGNVVVQRRGYGSTGMSSQTHHLTSVTAMDGDRQLRHYELNYGISASGSRSLVMTSLRECRDSGKMTCLPATTFEWSGAKFAFETAEDTVGMQAGSISKFEGMKFGDVDGDGRQDMVWIKDGTGGGCSTELIHVAFSRVDPSGKPFFHLIGSICSPSELVGDPPDSSWFLFDYDGDGKDDLFLNANSRWVGYRSHGRSGPTAHPFAQSTDMLAGLVPVIPGGTNSDLNPQLSDLNGDGLLDLVYFHNGAFKARIMQRGGSWGFQWGSERAVQFQTMTAAVAGAFQKHNYQQLNDFNGDARSDLLVKFAASSGCGGGGGPGDPDPPGPPIHPQSTCTNVFAMAVDSITSNAITLLPYDNFGDLSRDKHSFADINGDGLTDFVRHGEDISRPSYRLNIGTGFAGGKLLGNDAVYHIRHLQVADVNGDGRADLVVPAPSAQYMNVHYGSPIDGFSTPGIALPKATTACGDWECLNERSFLFGDYDGDGVTEFVRIQWDDGGTPVYFSRANQRFKARDSIVRITNGLGAKTEIVYAPLTDTSVYRRDAGSRNAMNHGRGSPIQDLLAPLYVVSEASSSSPNAVTGASGMAVVHYRYAGAKMQAGGRGFLGFRDITTFDPNQSGGYVATSTVYRQDYPFIGMPLLTRKRAFPGQTYQPDVCTDLYTDPCFYRAESAFPPLGGAIFSDSAQSWESSPVHAPGVQVPVQVRTAATDENLFDPNTGAATSGVLTEFGYGSYGNVTSTRVDTFTGVDTLTSSVLTSNIYAQDNAAKWRLGRLTEAEVTHQRSGQSDVVRITRFGYYMDNAATGLLKEERTQPGGGAYMDVRKLYTPDAYGNRVLAVTCLPSTASCDPATLSFHQSSLHGVHRYSRVEYDGRGRFPVATFEPFWNGSGGAEVATQEVAARDIFGEVAEAYDINGVKTVAIRGAFGRDFFAWRQTAAGQTDHLAHGVRSMVTYRWCGTASGQVNCPAGARFRQKSAATGTPTQWTYFDVLGRAVMQASETFNYGMSGKDVSAVCTAYDVTGKPKQVSNPFFLAGIGGSDGPTGLASVCAAATRKWTTTSYDLLGRTTAVESPDPDTTGVARVTHAYHNRTTGTRDPRQNLTNSVRNGKGELTQVVDALGLGLNYDYDTAGNLVAVRRNAGRGDVVNTFAYDALGRKVAQQDPDSGYTEYTYNALGELIVQEDAAGQRIEQEYDARGRVWRRTVKLADGTVESQSTFVYDTATNGLGQLASEQITGTYAAWRGASHMALGFKRTYTYDPLGRPLSTTTWVDGIAYPSAAAYDALGRPFRNRDASGEWAKTEYDSRGFVRGICFSNATDNVPACDTPWMQSLETDAWGHMIREQRSHSGQLLVTRTYNALSGRPERICADKPGTGGVCDLVDEGYAWDRAGNLHTRQKETRYLETFTYDPLNRLTHAYLEDGGGAPVLTHWGQYDRLGNVCAKLVDGAATGTGLIYDGRAGCGETTPNGGGSTNTVGPHRVNQVVSGAGAASYLYDARGNQTLRDAPGTANDRTIHYTADDKPYAILKGSGTPTLRARFWYGPDGSRYKRDDLNGRRTLYLGNVEIVTQGATTTVKRMIGGTLLQTIVNGVTSNRFLFHDQLGSLVKATDALGSVLHGLDYTPNGARRSVSDPTQVTDISPTLTERGFTGHEHVDGFDLIHMNGRIYDPSLGRFLQADPLIQAPDNAQSWNAYTYVFNNPLRYTDPTGMLGQEERQWLGAIIMIAAVITQQYWAAVEWGTVAGTAWIAGAGFVSGAVATQSWRGGLLGSMTAVVGSGVAGLGTGIDAWAVQTFTGGVMGSLQGGDFGHAFVSAGLSAAFMPQVGQIGNHVGRTVTGAIVGGTISRMTGGKFANGAVTGAIQAAMAGSDKSTGSRRRAGQGRRLERRMTAAEKSSYEAEVVSAVDKTANRLSSLATEAYDNNQFAEAWDYRQAANALSSAGVEFDLDNYGPNDAEMTFGTGSVSRKTLEPVAVLTVYKGAYEAYLYGSPAALRYSLNIGAGSTGLLKMIAHESGHGVYYRNYSGTGKRLPNRESLADAWANRVWP